MSEISDPHEKCPFCRRLVNSIFEMWRCDCGEWECCFLCRDAMARRIRDYHLSGECGLDAAFYEALSRDD